MMFWVEYLALPAGSAEVATGAMVVDEGWYCGLEVVEQTSDRYGEVP